MLMILTVAFVVLSHQKHDIKMLGLHDMVNNQWNLHKSSFNLSFDITEDEIRKEIFKTNLLYITKFNAENNHMELRVNKFAHLTDDEFANMYLSKPITASPSYTPGQKGVEAVDWRKKGVVNSIKYQGPCGSCWAFSAASALESHYAIKTGKLYSLSEQELIDCSSDYGNHGCYGGWMNQAFNYIKDHGICLEKTYPYMAEEGKCRHLNRTEIKITGHEDLESGNEQSLTHAISFHGPVSVAVNVQLSFKYYSRGIYYEPKCNPKILHHALVVVGVAENYYIVRNSWGGDWGDGGYILMSRNRDNNCGIATNASYPLV